jgi:predicted nuclease of predicted toxin-antitoxin system
VKLLLDEMYPATLAMGVNAAGIEAITVADLGLAGCVDADVFATGVADGYVVLTENVGDFTRLAAECITRGQHHRGLLIALSSRFSRRPAGIRAIIAAIKAIAHEQLDDRFVYLDRRPEAQ